VGDKLHGLSPRANYTDQATAACQRSDCQLLRIEGATWSAWRIPTVVFSVFLSVGDTIAIIKIICCCTPTSQLTFVKKTRSSGGVLCREITTICPKKLILTSYLISYLIVYLKRFLHSVYFIIYLIIFFIYNLYTVATRIRSVMYGIHLMMADWPKHVVKWKDNCTQENIWSL
jgi:hypothetical protein